MGFTVEILQQSAAVWAGTLLRTDWETSTEQFYHCRLKCGTCVFFVFNSHTSTLCACAWVLCICVWVLYVHVWMCVCVRVQLKKLQKLCNTLWKGYIIKVCTVWVHSYWNKLSQSQEQAYNLSKIYFFSEV